MGDLEEGPMGAEDQSTSRFGTQYATALGGVDDGTMEDIIEKLKVLEYESNFCRPRSFRPLHRAYFAAPAPNPNEQFFYFVSLAAWLMELAGHRVPPAGQFDDPNVSANNILLELKAMEFNVKDVAASKLRVGHGDAVLHVLTILLDKVLVLKGWVFQPPQYPADVYEEEIEPEGAEDDAIRDEVVSEGEGEEEWYGGAAPADGDEEGAREASSVGYASSIDPDLWKLELERVAPHLRLARRTETKDWRSHVDWIVSLLQSIEEWFPEVKAQLDKVTGDLAKAIERIQKREQTLSQQFETWVEQYRTQRKDCGAVFDSRAASRANVAALAAELAQVSERLEAVKAEISRREGKMTDTSPLVQVKEALAKLKAEVRHMELRIGVLQHAALQHQGRRTAPAPRPSRPEEGDEQYPVHRLPT